MKSVNILHKILIGCAIIGTVVATSAYAQPELYDDFSGRRLDDKKWYGEQTVTGGSGGLELIRRINRDHRLVLRHRVMGGNDSDTGRHISRNRLRMTDAETVTGMQVDTQVRWAKLSSCTAEGASDSAARFRGALFLWNDGSTRWEGDAKGDMGTVIEVYRSTDTDGALAVRGFLFRCLTSGCGTSDVLDSVDLGTVERREVFTMGMSWDKDHDTVSFWKNEEKQSFTYAQDDADPPVTSNKRLEVRVEAGNCTSEQTAAEIRVLVDNVMVHR